MGSRRRRSRPARPTPSTPGALEAFTALAVPTTHHVRLADWLGPCTEWRGPRQPLGWGVFRHAGGTIPAHTFALAAVDRRRPPGWVIDHLCHTYERTCPGGPSCPHRRCVNPAHLEWVPRPVAARRVPPGSVYRQVQRTRIMAWPTCRVGHPYLPGCYTYAAGERVCRLCAGEVELSDDWRDLAASGWRLG